MRSVSYTHLDVYKRQHTDDPHGGDLTDLAQLLHPGLNAAAHLPDDRDSRQSDCHASSISSL